MRRIALLALLPAAAVVAHEGHGEVGFVAGFAHPWLGWDHLVAMIAVGLLAARVGGAAAWALPAAFIAALTGGALLGQAGLMIPGQEHVVAASVIGLGLLLVVAAPTRWAAPVIAVAGLFHGLAHGSELTAGASTLMGMIVASAVLHGLGAGCGLLARHATPTWHRWVGATTATVGAALVAFV